MKIQQLVYSLAIGATGILSLGAIEGAYAQQSGLVNVRLGRIVLEDIARDINVNVSDIPVNVQAPIGVAANVCGISANVLAADLQDDGTAICDAQNTSQALNQIVLRSINAQR